MDKKIVGLAGVMAAAVPGMAVAAPAPAGNVAAPQSYADLLQPIPNAVEQLKVSDAALRSDNEAKVELAQYYYHHHHHHFFHRRFYHHHHHHFFHRRFFHHHHHHHFYY